jgi:hypothetical protein
MAVIAPSDFRVLVVSLRSSLPVDCEPGKGFLLLMAVSLGEAACGASENMSLFVKVA